jgi:nucleotide-binding universal stress UspA family protein
MMSPSIVCGIDGSRAAQAALEVASALAPRLGLRLVVVHAVPAPTPTLLLTAPARVPVDAERVDLLGRESGAALLEEAAGAHDLPPDARRLELGGPVTRLATVAAEEEARLLVVGTRGDGPLRAALLGSVSTSLVRSAPCPVVVVPPGLAAAALEDERILCGIAGAQDGRALEVAAWLSGALRVPLTVAHVVARDEAPCESAVRAAPTDADVRVLHGDPADELTALTAAMRPALVVVGSRERGIVTGGVLGSVSRALVREGSRPVVVCRREAS